MYKILEKSNVVDSDKKQLRGFLGLRVGYGEGTQDFLEEQKVPDLVCGVPRWLHDLLVHQ